MNTQKYLLEGEGIQVDKLELDMSAIDWYESRAIQKDYSNSPSKVLNVPICPREQTEEYLENKISLLQSYENIPDEEIPVCSESERWRDPPTFAVMKNKSAKRATKLFDNPIEASLFAKQKGGYVEIREAVDKRCINYCNCNKFCSYYQEHYGEKDE